MYLLCTEVNDIPFLHHLLLDRVQILRVPLQSMQYLSGPMITEGFAQLGDDISYVLSHLSVVWLTLVSHDLK